MSTQRQRARTAANASAARETEVAAKLAEAESEGLVVPVVEPALDAGPDTNAALCALTDGSTIALAPVVADQAANRFKGQPPKSAPPAGHRQVGSFRFRSKWGPHR